MIRLHQNILHEFHRKGNTKVEIMVILYILRAQTVAITRIGKYVQKNVTIFVKRVIVIWKGK